MLASLECASRAIAVPEARAATIGDECRPLRASLGQFATGVAIAVARSPEGELAGLTINSFASVSLDPPLVAWNLACGASTREAFERARFHSISVLSAGQRALAQRFATRGVNRFAGVGCRGGAHGSVLIDGALAHFVCRLRDARIAGDHVMLVADVVEHRAHGGEPLIFHVGRYWKRGVELPPCAATEAIDEPSMTHG